MPGRRDDERRILTGFEEEQAPYDSGSQKARAWSEGWMQKWIYCPACGHDKIEKSANNTPALDFTCPSCGEQYELKSKKGQFGNKVVDGAYQALRARLDSDTNPNFAFLSYNAAAMSVSNFFVVPRQFVTPDLVEVRRPLAATARRAGWIGCNIRLNAIPYAGRVFIVQDGEPRAKTLVRAQWDKSLFLRDKDWAARGWLIEVMTCCELIGSQEFTIEDVYRFEQRLAALYPENRHVREKMRQQLQVLRDNRYLAFLGKGRYRLL